MISVVALTGGAGIPSATLALSELLTESVRAQAGRDGVQLQTHTVQVRDHASAIAEATVQALPTEELTQALRLVETADLVIATTPVFRGAYAGLFKAFVDLLDPVAVRGTPVLLGATGGSAGHRLMIDQSMRPLFAYFGALLVPTGVYAVAEELGIGGPDPALQRRARDAASQALALCRLGD